MMFVWIRMERESLERIEKIKGNLGDNTKFCDRLNVDD